MSDRAKRLKMLEYERQVIRNATAAVCRVFDVDGTHHPNSETAGNLTPEAVQAVLSLRALDAVIDRDYRRTKESCGGVGHEWLQPVFGTERICAICGQPEFRAEEIGVSREQ